MAKAHTTTRFGRLWATVLSIALAPPSCQKSVTAVCTANLTPALAVTARDSASGALLTSAVILNSDGRV